jgi:hypothetical protein
MEQQRRASSYPDTQEATARVMQRKMVRKRFFNGLDASTAQKVQLGYLSSLIVLW